MIPCNILDVTFVKWLDTELDKRNLNRSQLARKAGISHASLSIIYSGDRNPGVEVCTAIANALKLPPEPVYRMAGLLPPERKDEPSFDELKFWYNQMTPDEQEEFLELGRLKVELRNRRKKGKRLTQPKSELT